MAVGGQQFRQFAGRTGDEIALRQVAAGLPAGEILRFRLHALGHHPNAKHVRKIGDGADEQALALILRHAADEVPVDFHVVDGLVAEQLQLGEAETEIVEREAAAHGAQRTDDGGESRSGAIVVALGELEADRRGRHPLARQGLDRGVDHLLAAMQRPAVEIKEQLLSRDLRHAGEFRDGAGVQHLLEFDKDAGLRGDVKKLNRRGEVQAAIAAQQGFVAVDVTRVDFDDRLERVVDDQLGERHNVIARNVRDGRRPGRGADGCRREHGNTEGQANVALNLAYFVSGGPNVA